MHKNATPPTAITAVGTREVRIKTAENAFGGNVFPQHNIIPYSRENLYCSKIEILLASDGSEPAEHAREVAVDRFDPDVVTVPFVFDPGEASYETPDPFSTDAEPTDLAAERAAEVFTESEAPAAAFGREFAVAD